MAKSDKNGQLNIEPENAIDLLIQGKSDREVAEAIGVARQTVNQWRNQRDGGESTSSRTDRYCGDRIDST